MNLIEMGGKVADFVLGPKVEGEIVLVLSDEVSSDGFHLSRYAVKTAQEQQVVITVPKFASHTTVGPSIATQNHEFSRGDSINKRVGSVQPWNGQLI